MDASRTPEPLRDTLPPPGGLTGAEAAARAARGLGNAAPRPTSRTVGEIVRANVLTRFNAIIGALFVVMLLVGPFQDTLFGLVILANSAIGVLQELRAKHTLDRLALVGTAPVRVRRDGEPVELPPAQIVLGDEVMVGGGDEIAVDGVVTAADGLEVDESLLTGEAEPRAKVPGDRVLSGSFVVSGTGGFTATRVGRQAYAARLVAEASRFTLAHSQLRAGIDRFLKYITWLIVPTAILLTVRQLTADHALRDAISGSVAGVVPMIPEGLVLLTSMAFAVGVVRLGRRRCLVQELPAIEVLARVDVLCLDKTGTLTEPGLELAEIRDLAPRAPVREALAALVAVEERPNPTLQAIAAGLASAVPPAGWRATRTVPFSSARRWSGACFETTCGATGWVLGAPDVVMAPDDPARRQAETLAATGLRVLALGSVSAVALAASGDAAALGPVAPAALIVLRQRLRPEAHTTLRYFARQGVTVKVISGDNAASVGAVAAALGVPGAEHPVDARTLPEDPAQLAPVLEDNAVFGRVAPQQKRVFVAALHQRGHTVAMTGDGVNDVLALKDADLGIAMGSGSPATKAVAQVVLLDDDFAALPHLVAEGRRVLGNIERVADLFLTKTFYSVLLALLVGVAGLPFPFLPRHLTLIGALTIGVPAFFLALAPNPQRAWPGFVRRVLRFAIPAGIVCAAATFTAYYLARATGGADLAADRATAALTLFNIALWVLVLAVRPYTWWRAGLVLTMAAVFWLIVALPYTSEFFAVHPGDLRNDLTGLTLAVGFGLLLTVVTGVGGPLGRLCLLPVMGLLRFLRLASPRASAARRAGDADPAERRENTDQDPREPPGRRRYD